MLQEEELSENYISLLREINAVEEGMRAKALEGYMEYANAIFAGITTGVHRMFSLWLMSQRRAKSEMDAIWISMKNSALRALAEILNSAILTALVKLLTGLFGGIPGFISGAAISVPGVPSLPSGQMGALIKKEGVMGVHKDEMIIPASIIRKHSDNYDKSIDNSKTIQETFINIPLIINSPVVDDRLYWEKVVEEFIIPAVEKVKERTQ